ncbi:MAG TPA: inositol monophosphatase [Candidatus Saccharimonadales bacterium]
MNYSKELKIAEGIAKKAGDIMRQYFDGGQQCVTKADGSPVTIADTEVNRMVIEELEKYFPDDGVIGEEESTSEYGMGRKWFCDPIDGTKAYTWGVPTAMFSLALVVDGVPVLGVAYEPMLDRIYTAVKGKGAFFGDQRLCVNDDALESGILAVISSPYRIRNQAAYFDKLLERKVNLAVFSGAVAKSVGVATGRYVGYIEELLNAHDIAAVQVIVEEAGGKVTDLHGKDLDYLKPIKGAIVTNSKIHNELVKLYEA